MRKDAIILVRLTADLHKRLETTTQALDLSKNDVTRHAIRSSVETIEQNGYRIGWPLSVGSGHTSSQRRTHHLDKKRKTSLSC